CARELRKVSVVHRHRRDAPDRLPLLAVPHGLIVGHKEQTVSAVEELRNPHRSAKRKSVLVESVRLFRRDVARECKIVSIKRRIPQELESRSMVFIGAALRRNVDLRNFPPELSRINAGLHLELL